MFYFLVNYNTNPNWVKEYTNDYLIYDRSDILTFSVGIPKDKLVKSENVGHADYDKLLWLVENYDNLPEVFFCGKANLWKHITVEEYDKIKDNKDFTPILTQNHRTYSDKQGKVCYYKDGMYYERADDWFVPAFESKFVNSWKQWTEIFDLPYENYIPFAPGGNYILTKERVHRYSKEFYIKMRNMLPHTKLPLEAQFAERSYYLLWR